MIGAWLFGAPSSGPAEAVVPEGHRGIDVQVDGQMIRVDLDALAEVSGLFLQAQSTKATECPLEDFPGGATIFLQIVDVLTNTAEAPHLQVTDENVLSLLEAAWLLECPKVIDQVVDSAFVRSLSSRRAADLLEHILPFTAASSPPPAEERPGGDGKTHELGAREAEDFMRIFLLETSMWQCTERAVLELVKLLDAGDFALGPRLATGSLRVSCELLRLCRRRGEESSYISGAFQPLTTMWKNLTDKPLRARVVWDAHLFAQDCLRKHLEAATSAGAPAGGGRAEDREDQEAARADISNELYEAVDDRTLLALAPLAAWVDIGRAPPNWAALLLRAMLLTGRREEARKAFPAAFASSPQARRLAWRAEAGRAPAVPAVWLCGVADLPEASEALLRILGGYRRMSAEGLSDVLERVLLAEFARSECCDRIVLASPLVSDVVGACFDAGRKARERRPRSPRELVGAQAPPPPEDATPAAEGPRRCPEHWAGEHALWRLERLGARLFAAAFVPQRGFLPAAPEDGRSAGSSAPAGLSAEAAPCPEPVAVKVRGACLWDEGLLKIRLLHQTMDEGRARPGEPVLHFGRQVIMRHLWGRMDGAYFEVPRLQSLWELACWPLCEDAGLIREALEYLKGTYRDLWARQGAWVPEHEDALFQMFSALDLARLPVQALMSPWVPPQVQTVRVFLQHQPAEQLHAELQQEVVAATESLKAIKDECSKLANKLNIVEQRTVINKSQISDAQVVIEERLRRKREAALRETPPTLK